MSASGSAASMRSKIARVDESDLVLLLTFVKYYGPTMNEFEAAENSGKAGDLQKDLKVLFNSQNKSPGRNATSIPATFRRVTVAP
jgi:hypothetical protein